MIDNDDIVSKAQQKTTFKEAYDKTSLLAH